MLRTVIPLSRASSSIVISSANAAKGTSASMTQVYVSSFHVMSAEPTIEPEGVDAVAFAGQVKQVSDEDLRALMSSEMRGQILDEIFRRMVEHFRPDRAQGVEAAIHWKILDRPEGGYDHYEFVMESGRAALNQPPARDATLEFRIGPVHFLRL